MKELLNNIVQKMNNNMMERRPTSEFNVSTERKSSDGTSVGLDVCVFWSIQIIKL